MENELESIIPAESRAAGITEREDSADNGGAPSEELGIRQTALKTRIGELEAKLLLAEIKTALLCAGVEKDKLDEGASLAGGLCAAGKSPGEAAEEISGAYPHLKAVRRDIPQFSAGSSGSGDGFSAIRKIFSGR